MKVIDHGKAAAAFINDEVRTDWHDETLWFVREKRDKAAHGIPEWELLRDKAYIKGSAGVAENGSVWIYESQMINRLLPFICQHLILIIEKRNIVATMHHAYQQINTAMEGFGVFIAGPSKTADIEQSLVIGAHDPRSLTVYLIDLLV